MVHGPLRQVPQHVPGLRNAGMVSYGLCDYAPKLFLYRRFLLAVVSVGKTIVPKRVFGLHESCDVPRV